MELLKLACQSFPYDQFPEGKIQDNGNGDNPFHLVMERKYSPDRMKICEILSNGHFNPNVINKHGKRPGDGQEKDKRYEVLKEAAKKYQDTKKKGDKKKKKKSKKAATFFFSDQATENHLGNSTLLVPVKPSNSSSETHLDSEEAFH